LHLANSSGFRDKTAERVCPCVRGCALRAIVCVCRLEKLLLKACIDAASVFGCTGTL